MHRNRSCACSRRAAEQLHGVARAPRRRKATPRRGQNAGTFDARAVALYYTVAVSFSHVIFQSIHGYVCQVGAGKRGVSCKISAVYSYYGWKRYEARPYTDRSRCASQCQLTTLSVYLCDCVWGLPTTSSAAPSSIKHHRTCRTIVAPQPQHLAPAGFGGLVRSTGFGYLYVPPQPRMSLCHMSDSAFQL